MAVIDDLKARYAQLAAALSTLPPMAISEEGRSIDIKAIRDEMLAIKELIALEEGPIFKQSRIL